MPELLAETLAAAAPAERALRVALDGPACAQPLALAGSLLDPLRRRGHASTVIAAAGFWRDASLRFEHGRRDLESYRHWLDAAALQREVLDPLGPDGDGCYLPALRDPASNRSARCQPVHVPGGSVVLVAGEFLLGRDLTWDRVVHLSVSAAARRRQTAPDDQWTLPAFDDYDRDVEPGEHADVLIKLDDPRHPALQLRSVD